MRDQNWGLLGCNFCFIFCIGDVKIFEEKDDDVCEKCGKEEGADQSENTAQSPSTSLVECRKSLRAKK